jgi:hypothetical protein
VRIDTATDGGRVTRETVQLSRAVGAQPQDLGGAQLDHEQKARAAPAMVRDALEHARPERGIERGLVDQADRRVEIIYPIGVNTSWSQINLHYCLVLSAQEIPMSSSIFL